MTGTTPLDAVRHAALRLDDALHGAGLRSVAIGKGEIALCAADYPLCFTKDAGTGMFRLVALLTLGSGGNLFWRDGDWHATYVPEAARFAPFVADARGVAGLGIVAGHPRLGATGAPLIVDGAATPLLSAIGAAIARCDEDIAQAATLAARLAARGALRPLRIETHRPGGAIVEMAEVYALDAAPLADLADAAIVAMFHDGDLAAASIISASLCQFERLLLLARARDPIDRLDVGWR